MKLSQIEFRAMNSFWRRWGQTYFEYPLFRRLGLEATGRDVLEIGCGSGLGAALLHRQPLRSYLGVDVMEEQLAIARARYPQFQFARGDATNLTDVPDASRDLVIIFGVLHHIPDWRRAVDEIVRVLRPGGRFFVEEPRGLDLRLFEVFFRWGHPETDFGLRAFEAHCRARPLRLIRKQWTPLLTMYHWQKEPA